MAIFTNYKIKQNDTLPLIAQRFLGDSSRWIDIVSLNNLRYPYITEDVYESIGITKAYGNLTAPL
jgi:LysM repeat protein